MRRDVQEIFRSTPHGKQVMMFSATLSKEIRPVCKKFMQDVNINEFIILKIFLPLLLQLYILQISKIYATTYQNLKYLLACLYTNVKFERHFQKGITIIIMI